MRPVYYICRSKVSMTNSTHINYTNLSPEQRITAIQRLTALWAFCESGLGGLLHALQIPFTGLVVGGLAVIIITFIAKISEHNYSQILQSLLIVLVVKAMVSPYTPFPAYIAVSFQALVGFILFGLLRVSLLSILLLSIIAMLESAVQKLLILTFFFGRSFWKATDEMMDFIAKQLGISAINGSQWLITIYLLIYLLGGIFIAMMAYKIIKGFSADNKTAIPITAETPVPVLSKRKTIRNKLWAMIIVMLILSASLFVFAADAKQGWVAVIKTVSWTLSVIMIWYMLISPLFARFILWVLQKKESRYSESVSSTLSFLPVLRALTAVAWKKSRAYKGWARMYFFCSTLLHWSLVYSESPAVTSSLNKPA